MRIYRSENSNPEYWTSISFLFYLNSQSCFYIWNQFLSNSQKYRNIENNDLTIGVNDSLDQINAKEKKQKASQNFFNLEEEKNDIFGLNHQR